jgi:hypothetical protein
MVASPPVAVAYAAQGHNTLAVSIPFAGRRRLVPALVGGKSLKSPRLPDADCPDRNAAAVSNKGSSIVPDVMDSNIVGIRKNLLDPGPPTQWTAGKLSSAPWVAAAEGAIGFSGRFALEHAASLLEAVLTPLTRSTSSAELSSELRSLIPAGDVQVVVLASGGSA